MFLWSKMNKKNILYAVSLVIFVAVVIFVGNYKDSRYFQPVRATSTPLFSSTTPTKVTLKTHEIQIYFLSGDKNYSLNVPLGSTVYDVMNILASTTDFSFKANFYSGLGYFIEEINGVKNQGGTYWTLYVNSKYSEVGASAYKLSDGDSVEWKYEKGEY